MEYLRVETINPLKETSPFLLSWAGSGKEIEILLLKRKGERTGIYFERRNEDFLRKAGWRFSDSINFEESGRRIFINGDPRFLKFGKENYADKILELLNEEDSGFLNLSMKPHYFSSKSSQKNSNEDEAFARRSKEKKGWKLSIVFRNENLGNYLCHLFSSPKVIVRRGKLGFSSPVIAWWEVHQFIPTVLHSLDKGDIRIGSTVNRGDIFIDTRKNPHTLIAGSSGAGKSSMIVGVMNHILKNRLGKVILIDPHGDTAKKMEESDFKKFVISPDSPNSINVIGGRAEDDISYKIAEDFVSILRSSREVQYLDAMVGPRMEDLISRGIFLLAHTSGMTLVDFYNVLREAKIRGEIASASDSKELRKFLEELDGMSREERASTERAIGRLVNDPMIRSLICNPQDDGILSNAIRDKDLLILDLERSSLGYEDSRLLSNIFALHVWFAISSVRNGNYFLFLEEGQDYQSKLIADMLSSGRKFGLRVFFLTTSFKAISDNLESLLFSNVSNYIFMKLTDTDRIKLKEFIGTDIDIPNESFDFVIRNSSGQERGTVEPINFRNQTRTFNIRNFEFVTEKKERNLSSEIDKIISAMKECGSIFFIFEEFCQLLKGYDRSEVISLLKEKVGREQSVHYVGRISLNSGDFKGRHECFQITGTAVSHCELPIELKVTSELISTLLEKK